ncbi:MAG: hypothetical protein AAFZ07_07755, partial [Actinomycetota bacterium]
RWCRIGTNGDADFALDDNGQRIQDITFTEPTTSPTAGADALPLEASATSGLPVAYAASGPCRIEDAALLVEETGICTLTISQPGDDVWAPAPDLEIEFDVGAGQQEIVFEPPEVLAADDPPLELDATATSELPVEYSADGACEIIDDTLVVTEEGTCTLTITQPGDETWQPVERVLSLEVGPPANRQAQSLSFASPGNFPNGTSVRLRASASSGLPVGYTTSGACRASGTTLTPTRGGSCTITASQPGNGEWLRATSVTRSVTVTPGDGGTITFLLPSQLQTGQTFPLPGLTTRGLPVTYEAEGACSVDGRTLSADSDGTCTVTGTHPGNADWSAVSVVQTTQVATVVDPPDPQTINFAPIPSLRVGDSAPLTATATSGLDVTFTATTDTCSVSGSTVTGVATGTCEIIASQPGNADWAAADPVPNSGTVSGRIPTITITVSGPLFVNQTATVTATSTSGLPVTLTATGDCRLAGATLTGTAEGTCTITANQAGDTEWAAATETQSISVNLRPQEITIDGPSSSPANRSFGVTATATSGLPVSLQTEGPCSFDGPTVFPSGEGQCTITASQGGNTEWAAADDVVLVVQLTAREFTVSVTVGPDGSVTGSGISCPGTCTTSVVDGTRLVLIAREDEGSGLSVRWEGACEGQSGRECTLTIERNTSITANFEFDDF